MKDIDKKDLPDVSGGYSPDDGCFPPFPIPTPDYPIAPVGPFPFPEPMPSPIDPAPFLPAI